jgi:two-component system nitrogen regulation sensor histidine kinase GlnL
MKPAGRSISADDLAELLHFHPSATLLADPQGRIVLVNQAAEQLCNMGRSALIDEFVTTILRFDDAVVAQKLDEDPQTFAAYGVTLDAGRIRGILADFHMTPCENPPRHRLIAIQPASKVRDVVGRPQGGASRTAGAAAAMLAHEIKNPLAGIRGAAQLLARKVSGDDTRFSTLICEEVDRIAALIDRMQDFTRGTPQPVGAVNLYPAIQRVLESLRASNAGRVTFVEEFDPSIPDARVNHDAIVQIMMNLVKNAVEAAHGHDRPMVRVTTAFRHGLAFDTGDGRGRIAVPIEVAVSDNGPGIDPAIQDALFEPFVTNKREGQGLGLALVDKLVRDMGGLIQWSRNGEWTQFKVHLPAAGKETAG